MATFRGNRGTSPAPGAENQLPRPRPRIAKYQDAEAKQKIQEAHWKRQVAKAEKQIKAQALQRKAEADADKDDAAKHALQLELNALKHSSHNLYVQHKKRIKRHRHHGDGDVGWHGADGQNDGGGHTRTDLRTRTHARTHHLP